MSLWRRLPKRGFNNYRHATRYAVVNVGALEVFPDGSEVGWEQLSRAGLLPGRLGTRAYSGIKILGEGDIDRALIVSAHRFSKTARAKLEAAGCTLVELTGRYRAGPVTAEAAPGSTAAQVDEPQDPGEPVEGPAADEPAAERGAVAGGEESGDPTPEDGSRM
jgi:hypothetical protein